MSFVLLKLFDLYLGFPIAEKDMRCRQVFWHRVRDADFLSRHRVTNSLSYILRHLNLVRNCNVSVLHLALSGLICVRCFALLALLLLASAMRRPI